QFPQTPLIVASAQGPAARARPAPHRGASGCLPKSSSLEPIQSPGQAARHGDTCWPSQVDDQVSPLSSEQEAISSQLASLTPQQFRVLSMVCDGLLNKQIAYELQVSEATVKAHVTAIFRKLGVRTRTQAALALQQ